MIMEIEFCTGNNNIKENSIIDNMERMRKTYHHVSTCILRFNKGRAQLIWISILNLHGPKIVSPYNRKIHFIGEEILTAITAASAKKYRKSPSIVSYKKIEKISKANKQQSTQNKL